MSLALYQEAIKQLAQAAHGQGKLASPAGEARLDNPLCGDRVTMQVALSDARISALAHETKGCLLCRASAAVLALHAAGLDEAAVEAVTAELEKLLRENGEVPAGWPELAVFEPAREYPSRHRCVLLPFQALRAALRGRLGASSMAPNTAK